MSSDGLEVVDANIVILPEEPLKQHEIVNAMSLFERRELASFMRKPLTINQGLNLDLTLGAAVGTFQIESMRSQKTISLSTVRIEVHDRSGNDDPESTQIPEMMFALANAFDIKLTKAIGANWEVMFKSREGVTASKEIVEKLLQQAIVEKLLQQAAGLLPKDMGLVGGAARLFLSDPSGVAYTLAIEPRLQNPQTDELWLTCNANLTSPEDFSIGLLKEMFQQSHHLLFEVKESLFPAPQP